MMNNQNKLNFSKMRNLVQFKKCGMDLSTTSDEVAKLWDSILFQMYGFFDAPEVNGIQGCMDSILATDPEFPLINLFTLDISTENYDAKLNKLKHELKNQYGNDKLDRKWTEYEKFHIKTFIYRLEGYYDLAAECWLDQIVQNPQDILALRSLNNHYITRGDTEKISNPCNLCRSKISIHDVYYPFILSYEAFGLEEKGHLSEALNMATDSLNIYPWNSWASHTVAHIFDSNGNSKNGIEFMNRTKPDWVSGSLLACHNLWHVGLFHLNLGEIIPALDIYDQEIFPRLNSQFSHFAMSDAVALLTRIDMLQLSFPKLLTDINITERWDNLAISIGSAIESFSSCEFYDAHLALAMMGCNKPKSLDQMLNRCNDWVVKYENRIFNKWENNCFEKIYQTPEIASDAFVTKTRYMIPWLKAIKFFTDRNYEGAVNLLYPMRKELRKFGGSNAQNDVYYQLLASALFNAGGTENHARLKLLFLDRRDLNEYNGYYERMERSIIDFH